MEEEEFVYLDANYAKSEEEKELLSIEFATTYSQ